MPQGDLKPSGSGGSGGGGGGGSGKKPQHSAWFGFLMFLLVVVVLAGGFVGWWVYLASEAHRDVVRDVAASVVDGLVSAKNWVVEKVRCATVTLRFIPLTSRCGACVRAQECFGGVCSPCACACCSGRRSGTYLAEQDMGYFQPLGDAHGDGDEHKSLFTLK